MSATSIERRVVVRDDSGDEVLTFDVDRTSTMHPVDIRVNGNIATSLDWAELRMLIAALTAFVDEQAPGPTRGADPF